MDIDITISNILFFFNILILGDTLFKDKVKKITKWSFQKCYCIISWDGVNVYTTDSPLAFANNTITYFDIRGTVVLNP